MMNIRTTVVCLPIQDPDKTLTFYKNVFDLPGLQNEEGIITIELPNLSLFLMEKDVYETYSRKAGRGAQFPNNDIGTIFSCALVSENDVDTALKNAINYGGTATNEVAVDEAYGGYVGYIADPDGHLWELVYPRKQNEYADNKPRTTNQEQTIKRN